MSRGLGDVYKRQTLPSTGFLTTFGKTMDLEVVVYARQTPNFLIYLQNMDNTQKQLTYSKAPVSLSLSLTCEAYATTHTHTHTHTLTQMCHKHTHTLTLPLSLTHACKHTHMPTHTNMEDCRRLG